jgi:hypothetical protein
MINYSNNKPMKNSISLDGEVVQGEISFSKAGGFLRNTRENKIDNLVAQLPVFGLSLSDLEKVFLEFKEEFFSYIWLGTDTFKNAITNYNTQGEVLTILDTVANPDNNFTIRDSIIYELNK